MPIYNRHYIQAREFYKKPVLILTWYISKKSPLLATHFLFKALWNYMKSTNFTQLCFALSYKMNQIRVYVGQMFNYLALAKPEYYI